MENLEKAIQEIKEQLPGMTLLENEPHFCNKRYRFSEDELRELLDYAVNRRTE